MPGLIKPFGTWYSGERFSGWNVNNEPDEWVKDIFVDIGEKEGLPPLKQVWVNSMRGYGACVEEHREGTHPDDITVCLFFTSLSDDQGGALVVEGAKIQPMIGTYVVFPSSALHSVEELTTDADRVSAAGLYGVKEV